MALTSGRPGERKTRVHGKQIATALVSTRFARALASLLLVAPVATAGEYTIELPELLNHHWSRELVTYPFSAPKGDCVKGSLRLSGAHGTVPVQLADIEMWPRTQSVKSATLAFVVDDLPPLATKTYKVTYGPKPLPGAKPPADLTVKATHDHVEATTSRFGARLLLGEKTYDPPVAAAAVPGPVLAMRLADGTWFGGSRLYGKKAVAGYTARLAEGGPVFVRVECTYRYADGNTNTVTIQLNAQGNRLTFHTSVAREGLTDGWDLLLGGLPPLAIQFMPEYMNKQPGAHSIKGWRERAIADYPAGQISNLTPWGDWVNEFTQTKLHLAFLDTRAAVPKPDPDNPDPPPPVTPHNAPDARELVIARLDAGAWVKPPSPPRDRAKARAPLIKAADGTPFLRVSNKSGVRRWTVGESPSYRAKLRRVFRPSNTMQDELEDLDVVKDLVLEWPESDQKHPCLFLSPEEVRAAAKANPDALKGLLNVEMLRRKLGSNVFFDTMRQAAGVLCMYDAIIDSDLISPADRKLFRAQMAYLAYRLASPANWSRERGYNTGNPNMTVAHILNQGLAACVLSDHPMAREWSRKPIAYMNKWLNRVDSAGHWPESAGYGRVSESKFVYYAVAAHRAGLANFLSDERFKRMVMYYERTQTPPDPQRAMRKSRCLPRVTPPYGRGGNGNSVGLGGIVAKAAAKLDPAFSRILQWSYERTCFSTMLGERMHGYELMLTDRTLPAERPDWRSELLPSVGALFRGGVGEPEENYLLLVTKNPTNPDGEIWPSEVGALTLWFEHGKPLTRVFPHGSNYPYLHGLMLNRVMLASSYRPGKEKPAGYTGSEKLSGFAALPRLDYIGERYHWRKPWSWAFQAPPRSVMAFPKVKREGVLTDKGVKWHRQALYVRDAEPGGKNYLVLRDTVTGGQPTQWQFWTLSRGITSLDGGIVRPKETMDVSLEDGTGDGVDPAKALLAETPIAQPVIPKPVELTGSHFLAKGQFGIDIDTFIASPTQTRRHTLRHSYNAPQQAVVQGFRCTQDLLHLQLPGDGTYFVALVPREKGEAPPTFTSLADGTVIRVKGAFGSDYAFLADAVRQATAEGAAFSGTAACVQDRSDGPILALGAAGSVAYKGYAIEAAEACQLKVTTDALTVTTRRGPVKLSVTAPGGWKMAAQVDGAAMHERRKDTYELQIADGVTEVRLVRR